jgi:hypothetical protein
MLPVMTRAAVLVLLAACTGSPNDFPARSGGPSGVGPVTGGTGGTTGDGGVSDAIDGDAGVAVTGRICIVRDLRHLTTCDTTARGDASVVKVTIGGRSPVTPPAKTGEFSIIAPLGTDLVWHASGTNFVTTAMPFGPDNTIPIVVGADYGDLQVQNHLTILAEGQGSVFVRAVRGAVAETGVSATTNLVTANVAPLYDADTSAIDWREIGPTQSSGVMWFPGVQVTTTPARITLSRVGGTPVNVSATVEDQVITFLTQDVP